MMAHCAAIGAALPQSRADARRSKRGRTHHSDAAVRCVAAALDSFEDIAAYFLIPGTLSMRNYLETFLDLVLFTWSVNLGYAL
jgi:hypothetical protein